MWIKNDVFMNENTSVGACVYCVLSQSRLLSFVGIIEANSLKFHLYIAGM